MEKKNYYIRKGFKIVHEFKVDDFDYKYNNEKNKNNYENLFCYPNVQRRSKFKKNYTKK